MRFAAVRGSSSLVLMMLSTTAALRSVTRRLGRVVRLHSDQMSSSSSSAVEAWRSAGLGVEVSEAVASRWASPNLLQKATLGTVLKGSDAVIGAETGSGKTLAYLLPAIERVLKERPLRDAEMRRYPLALILVPNRELGTQLSRVAAQLGAKTSPPYKDSDALFSIAARHGGGSKVWPYGRGSCPEILVTTPSFMAPLDKELELWDSLRLLVLDEADMLLDGGYIKSIERCLVSLKRVEKLRRNHVQINTEEDPVEEEEEGYDSLDAKRCQRCVVAATLPNTGLKSVESLVKKHFKRATRLTRDADGSPIPMHAPVSTLEHAYTFVPDTFLSTKLKLLVEAVGERPKRTMVFVNTANAAVKVTDSLKAAGIRTAAYHKNVLPVKRLETLEAFAKGEFDILVCTDLAARGLDLPAVDHVIQLEFALSVVSHLHRIGRAARAGQRGRATSFYDATSADLVASIKASGEKVDSAFSRRRGFRKKLHKIAREAREAEEAGEEAVNPSFSDEFDQDFEGEDEDDEDDDEDDERPSEDLGR